METSGRYRDRSYRGSDDEYISGEDKETHPFHGKNSLVSNDEEAQRQLHTRRNTCFQRAKNIKADIPVYEGRIKLDEFIDWLNTSERVFDWSVAIKLTKHASIWWEQLQLKMRRAREDKSQIQTWEKVFRKKRVRARILSTTSRLYSTRLDYTEELEYLIFQCGIVEPEEQTIAPYLRGLRR